MPTMTAETQTAPQRADIPPGMEIRTAVGTDEEPDQSVFFSGVISPTIIEGLVDGFYEGENGWKLGKTILDGANLSPAFVHITDRRPSPEDFNLSIVYNKPVVPGVITGIPIQHQVVYAGEAEGSTIDLNGVSLGYRMSGPDTNQVLGLFSSGAELLRKQVSKPTLGVALSGKRPPARITRAEIEAPRLFGVYSITSDKPDGEGAEFTILEPSLNPIDNRFEPPPGLKDLTPPHILIARAVIDIRQLEESL